MKLRMTILALLFCVGCGDVDDEDLAETATEIETSTGGALIGVDTNAPLEGGSFETFPVFREAKPDGPTATECESVANNCHQGCLRKYSAKQMRAFNTCVLNCNTRQAGCEEVEIY